jgi:hypothetical protein
MYFFFINYLFLQKCLAYLFLLVHNIKKRHFEVHFNKVYNMKSLAMVPPRHPPPFCSVLLLFQTTRREETSHRPVVHNPSWRHSAFQSISGSPPFRVQGAAGLQLGSPSLSKHCTVSGKFPNHNVAFYYTPTSTGRGKFKPCETRLKLSRSRYLTVLPEPGLIRFKIYIQIAMFSGL